MRNVVWSKWLIPRRVWVTFYKAGRRGKVMLAWSVHVQLRSRTRALQYGSHVENPRA